MRLIPLSREVRKLSRTRKDDGLRREDFTRWLALGVVFAIAVLLTSPFYFYRPPAPQAGELLGADNVFAQTDFSFVMDSRLEEWERRREREHRRVWVYDSRVGDEVIRDLRELLATVETLTPGEDSAEEILAALRRRDQRLLLSADEAVPFVETLRDPRFRRSLEAIVEDAYRDYLVSAQPALFRAHMREGIHFISNVHEPMRSPAEALDRVLPLQFDWLTWGAFVRQRLSDEYGAMAPESDIRIVLRSVLSGLLRPNLRFDEEATQRMRAAFPRGDLSSRFAAGTALLSPEVANRELTDEEARLLRAHREAVEAQHFKRLMGHGVFVLLAFVILSFYVRKLGRDFEFTTYNVILISLPVLLGLGVQAFCILLADGNASQVGYLFPAGAIGMLGVLLLELRMALLLVTWGCLLFGLQVDLEWSFVIVGLFGGYTGVAAIYAMRRRYEVFVASTLIALVNAAVILILGFISSPNEMPPFADAGLGMIAGLGSFLVLAILPVIERFGIITDMQLLELTGLRSPMLRHVEEVAPGTWQHTLNVAKLAEAAATEIGVNYLLIRAGVYYHDIGKTKKPEYFTENQITKEDKSRHEQLKPTVSVLVIKNHVKEGVEMARREGLPERIIDFISQHHGTSVITYFYHKALEAQARGEMKEPVRIDDYRYPGPKPQTIEAAIVMLADSVEATATAKLSNRTVREDDIQQVVRTTIFDKFNDGQFDECNLTLRDLNTIREVFVQELKSRFHTRIDYPRRPGGMKPAKKEERRKEEEPESREAVAGGEVPSRT